MKYWLLTAALAITVFSSCEKENKECPGATEKTFAIAGFVKIRAGETFHLDIKRGNTFSIKATGCEIDLNDLSLTLENGGYLEIKYKNHKNNRYRVDLSITMPELTSAVLSGTAKATITGFENQGKTILAILNGASEQVINDVPKNVQIDVSGTSKLTIKGSTTSIKGVVSGAGLLQAYNAPADDIDLSASGTGKAYVSPLQSFIADASGASNIYYKGDPAIKDLSTSGAGKITKE